MNQLFHRPTIQPVHPRRRNQQYLQVVRLSRMNQLFRRPTNQPVHPRRRNQQYLQLMHLPLLLSSHQSRQHRSYLKPRNQPPLQHHPQPLRHQLHHQLQMHQLVLLRLNQRLLVILMSNSAVHCHQMVNHVMKLNRRPNCLARSTIVWMSSR